MKSRRRDKSLKKQLKALKLSNRKAWKAERRSRRGKRRSNPSFNIPWGKIALGVGALFLLWKGPAIYRGVKGLFSSTPTGPVNVPKNATTVDGIPPP